MALGGAADYLITGDKRARLLQRGNAGRTRIVRSADCCSYASLKMLFFSGNVYRSA